MLDIVMAIVVCIISAFVGYCAVKFVRENYVGECLPMTFLQLTLEHEWARDDFDRHLSYYDAAEMTWYEMLSANECCNSTAQEVNILEEMLMIAENEKYGCNEFDSGNDFTTLSHDYDIDCNNHKDGIKSKLFYDNTYNLYDLSKDDGDGYGKRWKASVKTHGRRRNIKIKMNVRSSRKNKQNMRDSFYNEYESLVLI